MKTSAADFGLLRMEGENPVSSRWDKCILMLPWNKEVVA